MVARADRDRRGCARPARLAVLSPRTPSPRPAVRAPSYRSSRPLRTSPSTRAPGRQRQLAARGDHGAAAGVAHGAADVDIAGGHEPALAGWRPSGSPPGRRCSGRCRRCRPPAAARGNARSREPAHRPAPRARRRGAGPPAPVAPRPLAPSSTLPIGARGPRQRRGPGRGHRVDEAGGGGVGRAQAALGERRLGRRRIALATAAEAHHQRASMARGEHRRRCRGGSGTRSRSSRFMAMEWGSAKHEATSEGPGPRRPRAPRLPETRRFPQPPDTVSLTVESQCVSRTPRQHQLWTETAKTRDASQPPADESTAPGSPRSRRAAPAPTPGVTAGGAVKHVVHLRAPPTSVGGVSFGARARDGREACRTDASTSPQRHTMYIGAAAWSLPREVAAEFPAKASTSNATRAACRCAEINSSFYRAHEVEACARWAAGRRRTSVSR